MKPHLAIGGAFSFYPAIVGVFDEVSSLPSGENHPGFEFSRVSSPLFGKKMGQT